MSDELKTQFDKAIEDVAKLPERPDPGTLLRLYAMYKQANQGDCTGDRPGMLQMEKRAKFDAWKGLEGSAQEEAMQLYIDLVEELKSA